MIRLSVDRSLYVALGAAAGAAALVGAVFPASTRYGFNVVPLSAFAVAAFLVLVVHFTPANERVRGIGTGALAGGLIAASITFYVTGNLWKAKYAAAGGGAMGAAVGTQFGITVDGFTADHHTVDDPDSSHSSAANSQASSSSPSKASSSSGPAESDGGWRPLEED